MPDQISRDGWLSLARKVVSPNHNKRSLHDKISLIVIHNISLPPGKFCVNHNNGSLIESFFCNTLPAGLDPFLDSIMTLQVSSHLLIYRDGSLVQFVSFNDRAWHAGQSVFQGLSNCNDYSIGIELEGTDNIHYTEEQYASLARTINMLMKTYPEITLENIVGHSDIAPGRKTDPGNYFFWNNLHRLLDIS